MATEQIDGARTPLHYQLALLGLDLGQHKPFVGKRVLDLCCGDGTLVKKLRELGIIAEGIDPSAPRGLDFFMCQPLSTTEHPRIPRQDDTYDLVLSFQNPVFNVAFDDTVCPYRQEEIIPEATQMIFEISRLLKSRGKAVLYPSLPSLKRAQPILNAAGLKDSFSECDRDKAESYYQWKMYAHTRGLDPELSSRKMYYATVLEKE
jgi:SAM-dependent methyltransferase